MKIPGEMKVGLVGAGYVSAYHARALRSLPFVKIVGIADLDMGRAKLLADQFQIPAVFPSLQAMKSAAPEVIHVLTPPASHAELALEAMEMGCHVFVEKPMAETVADCDRMIAKAHEKGVVLSVNHSARMDPIVLKALEQLRAGVCGEVIGADFLRSSDYAAYAGGPQKPPQFRNGSYPFQDLGVHGLYLLEAFLGPVRQADIRYYASRRGDPNLVFDEWRGLLECERGSGHLYISWNVRPMQNELIIHGTRGVMHVDCYLQTLTIRKTYPAPKPIQRIVGAGLNSLSTLWSVTANTVRFATRRLLPSPGIHISVTRFYEALQRGEAPPVSAEEGRRVIALLEGVSRRADEDKRRYLAERPSVRQPRILVTGAGGLVGSALARRLRERGEPIRLLLRRPPLQAQDDPDVHLVYGDLGDPAVVDRAVAGVETVFHVGAAMRGGHAEFQSGTIWGTKNIVDACERHGVRKLIHVSSLSVLDHAGHKPGEPITERAPYEPYPERRGFYTQTKLEAEKLVLQAAADGRVSAVVLRFGQIYGPGAEMVPPSGTIALAGRWLVVGNGDAMVPVVYLENAIDALMLAAERELPNGSIVHIVDPEGIRQREYVQMAQDSGRPIRAAYLPKWLLYLAGWGVEMLGRILRRNVPLSRYRVSSIRPLWPCDCTMAQQQLGWRPAFTVAEGFARTYGLRESRSQPFEKYIFPGSN